MEATATELALSIQLPVAAQVDEGGVLCVHYETLVKVLEKLGDEKIRLAAHEDGGCVVSAPSFECTVATHPADEFPVVTFGASPTHPELLRLTLLRETVLRLKRAVVPFAATEDDRPVLTGTHWLVQTLWDDTSPHLYVEAADGFRLAQLRISDFDMAGDGAKLNHQVPARFVNLLDRADVEEVSLWFYPEVDEKDGITSSGYVVAQVGPLWLRDTLIEGNFPEVANIIGNLEDKAMKVTLPVEQTRAALALLQVYSGNVRFEVDPTQSNVVLAAMDTTRGKCSKTLSATITLREGAASFPFGLRAKYVLDMVRAVRGDTLSLEADGASSPFRVSERSFRTLVMPLALGAGTKTAANATESEAESAEPVPEVSLTMAWKVVRVEDGSTVRDGFEDLNAAQVWVMEQLTGGTLEPQDATAFELMPYLSGADSPTAELTFAENEEAAIQSSAEQAAALVIEEGAGDEVAPSENVDSEEGGTGETGGTVGEASSEADVSQNRKRGKRKKNRHNRTAS